MSKTSAFTLWEIFWGGHIFTAEKSVETGKTDLTHALTSLQLFQCRSILSVQFSHSVMSDSLWHHGLQHARSPCPSPTPRAYSNLYPLSQWCHPTITSSVVPFSSHLQPFPGSGSFLMCQFFTSGGQSIGVSASASVLPMNILYIVLNVVIEFPHSLIKSYKINAPSR